MRGRQQMDRVKPSIPKYLQPQRREQRPTGPVWLLLGTLLAVLPLGSCGKSAGPFVTVLLSNFPPDTKVVTLGVSVAGETKQQPFSGNDTLSLITVEFPVGTRGDTLFTAQTTLADGCVLGSGSSSLTIDEDKAYDLTLPIVQEPLSKCGLSNVKLTVKKSGTAQGLITSAPIGVQCDSSCTQQTVEFRPGTQLKLSAMLTGDDEFVGWSGGCTGTMTDCSFTLNADTTVTATLNKCQGFCPLPATGVSSDLYAVWGASSSAMYAVGAAGTIVKYDGTAWSTMASGVTTNLRSISAPRDNTATILVAGDSGTLLQLGGSTWSKFGTAPPNFQITAVGANKYLSSLFIAGGGGSYYVWDGKSKWGVPFGYGNSKNLTGISFMPGSDEHFMSGAAGLLVRYVPGGIPIYPGQTTNTSANLNAVWAGTTAIYMVGDGGTIVKRQAGSGQDGVAMPSGTTANLRSVWGANDQNIFVVGDGGTVLKGDGTTWTKLPARTIRTLYGVAGADTSTIFAVGEAGTALRYKP